MMLQTQGEVEDDKDAVDDEDAEQASMCVKYSYQKLMSHNSMMSLMILLTIDCLETLQ